MNEILAYIDNPGSFRTGVDLYRTYGDGTDLRLFEKALKQPYVSSEIKERLITRLQAIAPATDQATFVTSPTKNTSSTQIAPEPESVTQLRSKGRKLKKEESYYHAQLVSVSKEPVSDVRQQKLYELVTTIMEIEYELDDIYDQIRAYEEKGEIPVDNRRHLINEVVEKMKRRDSIRPRIYRLKKELHKKLDHPERQKYEQELAEKEAELKQIEEELNL